MHVPSTAFLVSDTRGALGDECRWFDGYIYKNVLCQCDLSVGPTNSTSTSLLPVRYWNPIVVL